MKASMLLTWLHTVFLSSGILQSNSDSVRVFQRSRTMRCVHTQKDICFKELAHMVVEIGKDSLATLQSNSGTISQALCALPCKIHLQERCLQSKSIERECQCPQTLTSVSTECWFSLVCHQQEAWESVEWEIPLLCLSTKPTLSTPLTSHCSSPHSTALCYVQSPTQQDPLSMVPVHGLLSHRSFETVIQ